MKSQLRRLIGSKFGTLKSELLWILSKTLSGELVMRRYKEMKRRKKVKFLKYEAQKSYTLSQVFKTTYL
jgi:ribosomal protein L21